MHKRILAGLPLLAAALIFFGLWLATKIVTPAWRSELDQYITFKTNSLNVPITITRTVQASQPWRFSPVQSISTFGDCIFFKVANCYNIDEAPPTPPLPFPPDDVWCVLLETSSGAAETRWVVYIALHQDLYNADWIVHEGSSSPSDPQTKNDLNKIGCGGLVESDR